MERDRIGEEEQLISRGLYRLVGTIIGSEARVKLRRERWKVLDVIGYTDAHYVRSVMSGSMAEGFEMQTSDFDVMYWSSDIAVVENYAQFIDYHQQYKTLLMMNCDYTSPGFALVKCITRDESHRSILETSVRKCDELWVSSKLYMEYYLKSSPFASAHGPCQSGEMFGTEYDKAQCLKCEFFPRQATAAISRMRRSGWPPQDVIQELINDGCLLVPVASKKPMFEGASDLEWRISFSLAEKRLLHCMNHCEFLCYGLWKLFLTEVIKKLDGMEEILCSYFLKTIVFWEVSRDASAWTTSNFLSKFLSTLKTLIIFVNAGNCPNFFIPENNIFFGKVCGEKHKSLMSHLREFHNEGFLCLLRCPSLQSEFLPIIQHPLLVHSLANDEAQNSLRAMRLHFIFKCNVVVSNINMSLRELSKIQRVNISSDFMSTALAMRTRRSLQNIAEKILDTTSVCNSNKITHRYMKCALNILRNNGTYLCYGDLIIAKAYYMLGDYREAIQAANIVKSKLHNQTMYTWTMNVYSCYMSESNDITIEQFIEQHVATEFLISTLPELVPEIIAFWKSVGAPFLLIPPLVVANFLLILSHHKLNDMIQMYDVLRELHVLVHHDDNFHIFHPLRAISWEILGICQQLCGEHPAAYNSYINALNDRWNGFKAATVSRIISLPLFQ